MDCNYLTRISFHPYIADGSGSLAACSILETEFKDNLSVIFKREKKLFKLPRKQLKQALFMTWAQEDLLTSVSLKRTKPTFTGM